jgi:hypothetical protein
MTQGALQDPSKDELLNIFSTAFRSSPRAYGNLHDDPSPVVDMLGSSPLLDYIRQRLPQKLGDTKAGKALIELLPDNQKPRSIGDYAKRGIQAMPLGGYAPYRQIEMDRLRGEDAAVQLGTTRVGQVPDMQGFDKPTGTMREAAAQLAGVTAGDIAQDGLRNIWWFLNAPQALASLAVLSAVHGASQEYRDPSAKGPLIRNRGMRLAATVPAVIGMSMGVGNFGRQAGYKAAVPSEADPAVSADPLGEAVSRYFLGRTGALLPYDEFVKERPDVSRGEYEEYKAYLHGNSLPIKATLDGIQGPEVTFLGKSIPVATGILPAVAAAVGAGMGIRKAGARLRDAKVLDQAAAARTEVKEKYGELRRDGLEHKEAMAGLDAEIRAREKLQNQIDSEMLKQSLAYSSIGLTGAAVTGQALESIRRALKGRAEIEPAEDEQAVIPAPV